MSVGYLLYSVHNFVLKKQICPHLLPSTIDATSPGNLFKRKVNLHIIFLIILFFTRYKYKIVVNAEMATPTLPEEAPPDTFIGRFGLTPQHVLRVAQSKDNTSTTL